MYMNGTMYMNVTLYIFHWDGMVTMVTMYVQGYSNYIYDYNYVYVIRMVATLQGIMGSEDKVR